VSESQDDELHDGLQEAACDGAFMTVKWKEQKECPRGADLRMIHARGHLRGEWLNQKTALYKELHQ
jgi:hypothetical protein